MRDAFVPTPERIRRPHVRPAISVVIPVFCEEEALPELLTRLTAVLAREETSYEVIVVDDGSTDGTLDVVRRFHATNRRITGIALSRNFGHQAAITAGLAEARPTEAVVIMDGDGQDPPEAIPSLLHTLRAGCDVAYAVRASRPEGRAKRLAYSTFYRLLSRRSSIHLPVDAGDFGAMSRRVVDLIVAMPERRRYVRGLRAWVGFRQVGVPIERGRRLRGRPKYSLGRLLELAIDGLVGFGGAPLRWAAGLGLGAVCFGSMTAIVGFLVLGPVGMLPAAILAAGLVLGGAQLLCGAVLGEYVSRILQEVSGRPAYVIDRTVGRRLRGQTSRRRSRQLRVTEVREGAEAA